jgi:hypothetical protein
VNPGFVSERYCPNHQCLDTALCQGTCLDDVLDGNDTLGTAVAIAPGTYAGLVFCGGDTDYYKFPANSGDSISVSIVFAHAQADLTLILRDPSGVEIQRSETATDNEAINGVSAGATGDWIVQVDGLLQQAGYELVVQVQP